jgi:GAF domain-containing protein/DNA-binding LacI/PurR family transcriptional regulator
LAHTPSVPDETRPSFAIVINSLEGRYQSDVLRGILAGLKGNARALVLVTPRLTSGEDCTKLLVRLVDPAVIHGVILLANAIRLDKGDLERIARMYRGETGERVVSVGMEAPGIPSVNARDASGIAQAVQHLIEGHGYRRIGFLAGPNTNEEAERRLHAFRRAMTSFTHGNLLQERFIVPNLDFSFGEGEEGAATLLGAFRDQIEAIIAANDEMARGALHHIEKTYSDDARRPGVIGFDDTEYAVTTQPPLTTVHRPLEEEGRAAARLMLALHRQGTVASHQHRLGTRLQVRQSCGHLCPDARQTPRARVKDWLLQLVPDHRSAGELIRVFRRGLTHATDAETFEHSARLLLDSRLADATGSDIGVWHAAVLGLRAAAAEYVRHQAPCVGVTWLFDRLERSFDGWAEHILVSGQRLVQRNQDSWQLIRPLLDVVGRRPRHAEAKQALESALKSFNIWPRSWVCRGLPGADAPPVVQLVAGPRGPETFEARRIVPDGSPPEVTVVYPFGTDGSRGHFALELTNTNEWWTYVDLAHAAEYVADEGSLSFAPPRPRSDFPPPPPRDPPSTLAELRDRASQEFERLRRRVPFKTASLQLFEDDSRTLLAGDGFEVNNADRNLVRPISSDVLVAEIVRTKTATFADSTVALPGWTPYSTSTADVKAWIGAPVVVDEKVIGLLTLDFSTPEPQIRNYESAVSRFIDEVQPLFAVARPLVEVQQLTAGAAIVNQILDIIARKPGREEILRTIVDETVKHLNCSHCTLFLLQRVNGARKLVAACSSSNATRDRTFAHDEGIAGKVVLSGTSRVVKDVSQLEPGEFAPARKVVTHRSMLVAPIKVGSLVLGVISADQDAIGWFHERDARLVEALGQQAGIAIQRSQAIQFLKEIGSSILSLQSTSQILREVVESAIKVTNAGSGVIYHLLPDQSGIREGYHPVNDTRHPQPRLDTPMGLTRRIIAKRDIIAIPDLKKDEHANPLLVRHWTSTIGVPLLIDDNVIGVLFVDDEFPHEFTEAEQSLLRILAGYAAIALQKAEGSQRHARLDLQLQRLHELTVDTDLSHALNRVAESVTELLVPRHLGKDDVGSVSAGIRLYDPDTGEFGKCHAHGVFAEVLTDNPREDGSSTAHHVIKTGKALYRKDVCKVFEGEINVRPRARDNGVVSFAAVPLAHSGRVVGVLFVASQVSLEFTPDETRALDLFASHVASAIANASRYEAYKTVARNVSDRIVVHIVKYDRIHSDLKDECKRLEAELRGKIVNVPARLETATRRLQQLVRAFQQYGRITTVTRRPGNLNSIVHRVMAQERERLERHLHVTLDLSAEADETTGMDEDHITNCVRELVRNAERAVTESHGQDLRLRISTQRDDSYLTLAIEDSGRGFPKELAVREPFKGTDPDSSGIGLTMVEDVVRLHNGRITLGQSSSLGGAMVTLLLPRATEERA